jgi:hypothetical protein
MKFHTKNWRDDQATVRRACYPDGSAKLTVIGRYGYVLCDATVCLSDRRIYPADGNVLIRDWGENEGVLRALQATGIIGPTVRTHPSGVAHPSPVEIADGSLQMECLVHECPLLL